MVERIDAGDPDHPGEVSEDDGSSGVQFICPYCQDYAGKRESVRAHIRGKTDSLHKGKSGYENGSEPVTANGHQQTLTEPEPSTEPDTEPVEREDESDTGWDTWLVLGLFTFLVWLAQRTGNEETVRNRMPGEPR